LSPIKAKWRIELNDRIAFVIGNIGIVYLTKGELDKALEYYKKALKLEEELGNKKGIANYLGNIGIGLPK